MLQPIRLLHDEGELPHDYSLYRRTLCLCRGTGVSQVSVHILVEPCDVSYVLAVLSAIAANSRRSTVGVLEGYFETFGLRATSSLPA